MYRQRGKYCATGELAALTADCIVGLLAAAAVTSRGARRACDG